MKNWTVFLQHINHFCTLMCQEGTSLPCTASEKSLQAFVYVSCKRMEGLQEVLGDQPTPLRHVGTFPLEWCQYCLCLLFWVQSAMKEKSIQEQKHADGKRTCREGWSKKFLFLSLKAVINIVNTYIVFQKVSNVFWTTYVFYNHCCFLSFPQTDSSFHRFFVCWY